MFDLRKLIFGGGAVLPEDVAATLADWQALPAVALDEPHFHTRYVLLDALGEGEGGGLRSLAALGMSQGGSLAASDAFLIDPLALGDAGGEEAAALDRQLAAFLRFAGKSPLVTFHAPSVLGKLQKLLKARFGIDYAPPCIDLVWLLPSVFDDLADKPQSLDRWLEIFGFELEGRRDAMGNVLELGRLFQRLLARAGSTGLDTAHRLLDESHASTFLRRTH